jgi:DNA-directed RNA polymerase subunit RPC12/RpoP
METVQYKCPNCGGELTFNAQKQMFSCEYCMSDFTDEQIKTIFKKNESTNLDDNPNQETRDFEEHTNLYSCPSCGAEIMADENTSATFCYYCHNPVILTGRLSGDYKPGKVIPFKITKEAAIKSFNSWCGSRWFIPKDFKSKQQLEKMTGVYVPFWVADCNSDVRMRAIGKRIRSWTSGNYQFTETKEYSVSRRADVKVSGIPADGASKIPDPLMEAIEPFNYNDCKDFSMSYLSGFIANKYDVDKGKVFPRIRQRVTSACTEILQESAANYSILENKDVHIDILNTDWQYMLLPVWFMTYQYNGKTYSFAVNAQTGKTDGIPPLSYSRLLAFCGILTAVITVLSGLIGGLLL